MMAKQKINSLYADLDSVMDEQAFNRLDRTAPVLVGVLRSLVGRGEPPEVIAAHVLRHNPAAWVEMQQIRCACRHLERTIE